MMVIKTDGFSAGTSSSGVVNDALTVMSLWVTNAGGTAGTVTVGDWISEYPSDTTNPGGVAGESFRVADADNADALMGTCGVAYGVSGQSLSFPAGGGFIPVAIRGFVEANVDSGAAVAVGDSLIIGTTAGRAVEYADATTYNKRIIANCLTTPSGNLATVEILPHPRFIA